MALVSDKKAAYEKQVDEIMKAMERSGMETDAQLAEVSRLKALIEDEDAKFKRYQVENIRRKHNYLPLIVEILKILAKERKLMPIYEEAKQRTIERQQTKKVK